MVNLGDTAIMFGDKKACMYCKQQDTILKKNFKSGSYLYKKVTQGKPLKNGMVFNAIPTWYIPTGNGKGYLHEGLINGSGKIKLDQLLQKNLVLQQKLLKKKRKLRFGEAVPEIGTLAKYGKNFPGDQGFQMTNPWSKQVSDTWGDPLLAGTLGREFGPGKTDNIYSNNYYNNIRMAYPGGDLDTTLSLNRSCNQYNPVPNPSGSNAYPVTYDSGLIYNSKNPQITSFGKKKRKQRFGNLYSQMGPVPAQNYLLKADTFNKLYAGGGQGGPTRPSQGQDKNLFVNTAPDYKVIKSVTSFGKKKGVNFVKPSKEKVKQKRQRVKAGEGKTLVIKNGKVKVKD
jgi:hypothetical protein